MNIAVRIPSLTHASVNELIAKMEPGQMLIYHVGSLMHDRLRGLHFQTVHGVALAAYEAYERGEVTLVQHKIAPLTFEYIAIKAPRNAAKVDAKVAGQRAHADAAHRA